MGEEHNAPTLDYATPGPVRRRNVAAMVSVTSGLLIVALWFIGPAFHRGEPFFIACLLSAVAVPSGLVGLFQSRRRQTGLAFSICGVILGTLCLTTFLWFALERRSRPPANRVVCAGNLRQLGMGILLYSNDNQGRYSARWEDVLLTQDIGPEVFCCPSTDVEKAPGATTREQAANLSKIAASGAKHVSYVYVGQSFTAATVTPQAILAYEPLSNHGGAGMNVLFGDGHVEFLEKADSRALLNELTAGHNPPRPTQFPTGQR